MTRAAPFLIAALLCVLGPALGIAVFLVRLP